MYSSSSYAKIGRGQKWFATLLAAKIRRTPGPLVVAKNGSGTVAKSRPCISKPFLAL